MQGRKYRGTTLFPDHSGAQSSSNKLLPVTGHTVFTYCKCSVKTLGNDDHPDRSIDSHHPSILWTCQVGVKFPS